MMKREKILVVCGTLFLTVSLMGLAFLLGGCGARVAHVTDLPAGVAEQQAKNWDSAVARLHEIATATSSLRRAVIAARGANAFPDDAAYGSTILAIGKMDEAQLAASKVLRADPQHFGPSEKQPVAGYTQSILAALQTLNISGATNIKNPEHAQSVNQLLGEISATVAALVALTN